MSEWIGIIEAATILHISRNTVKKLVDRGILPAYEVTGVKGYQFKREDVEVLLKRVEPKKSPLTGKSKKR